MPCQSKQGSDRNYNAVERLAPGASVEALHEELLSIFDGLVAQYPDQNGEGWYTWADPIGEFVLGMNRQPLYPLGGADLLVLALAGLYGVITQSVGESQGVWVYVSR